MPGPRYGSRHGTSRGEFLNQRGYFNPVPVDNYLSGDGKSHVYRGPGYYIPSERRWVTFVDYHSLPTETRRDAILMESEDQWREFQQKRDMKSFPMGELYLLKEGKVYFFNFVLPQTLFRTKGN